MSTYVSFMSRPGYKGSVMLCDPIARFVSFETRPRYCSIFKSSLVQEGSC